MHVSIIYLFRASGDGGLGELLKLEPIKEVSHSPPSHKNTTKPITSADPPSPTTHDPSMSSQKPGEPVTQKTDTVPREKEDITARGARDTFKSPTGILAGDLDPPPLAHNPSMSSQNHGEPVT